MQPKTALCEALPGATATGTASTSTSAQYGTSSRGFVNRSACRRVLMGLSVTFHHSHAFVPEWEKCITLLMHDHSFQLSILFWGIMLVIGFYIFIYFTLDVFSFFVVVVVFEDVFAVFITLINFYLFIFFCIVILLLFALRCCCWRHQNQILRFVVEYLAKISPVNECNDLCTGESCQGQMGWCRERYGWHETAKTWTNLESKSESFHHKASRKNIICMWELDNHMQRRLSFQMAEHDLESYQ